MSVQHSSKHLRMRVEFTSMLLLSCIIVSCVFSSVARATEIQPAIRLTDEEIEWLRQHPVIRVAQDPNWPPIEFACEDGSFCGMSKDYLELIEQRLGIKFARVTGLTWQQAYDRLRRFDIDMTTSVSVTPERTEFWAFTRPYMEVPIVIATAMDVTFIRSMDELVGRKVSVVEGYLVCELMPQDYPGIELVRVENTLAGLEMVSRGEVFAHVDNMLVISYYLAKMRSVNLKIAGETPYVNAQAMAVRNDWPELAHILQKALDSITPAEHEEIYRRWLPIRYEQQPDYGLVWRVALWAVAVTVVLLLWNRRLAAEIRVRRKAEHALERSEARFKLLFDSMSQGVVYQDADARVVAVNPAAERILATSAEALIGQELTQAECDQQLVDVSSFSSDEHPAVIALKSGRPQHAVMRARSSTGEERWIEISAKPQFEGASSTPYLVLSVLGDITEQKLAWERVRKAQAESERLLKGANESRRVLLSLLEDKNAAEAEIQRLNQELEDRVEQRTEELRRSEQQLRKTVDELNQYSARLDRVNAELAAANRELEAFSYSVSHDLKAPLRHIAGFAELLDAANKDLDPKSRHYIRTILEAAKRMGQLIDDLLTFSRMGRVEMLSRKVNMNELVKEVVSEFEEETAGRKIDWVVQELPSISGDPSMLRVVFENLISNAVKFTRAREKARIEIGGRTDGKEATFYVRDNGAGFDMAYVDRIFDVFQRLHSRSEFEGTGIGLANVKRVVERHGGTVWAQGELDEGATFYIALPVREV